MIDTDTRCGYDRNKQDLIPSLKSCEEFNKAKGFHYLAVHLSPGLHE